MISTSTLSVVWCDSDPYIDSTILENAGFSVYKFTETQNCINFMENYPGKIENLQCILTSMMERGGRKEKGLLNGLQMVESIKNIFIKKCGKSYAPLLAMISLTADEQICREYGFSTVVIGDRYQVQKNIIYILKEQQNRNFRKIWKEIA